MLIRRPKLLETTAIQAHAQNTENLVQQAEVVLRIGGTELGAAQEVVAHVLATPKQRARLTAAQEQVVQRTEEFKAANHALADAMQTYEIASQAYDDGLYLQHQVAYEDAQAHLALETAKSRKYRKLLTMRRSVT